MKRIGYLYQDAFTRDALLTAFHAAARHKSGKRACFNFERRLALNLESLYCELRDGIYRLSHMGESSFHQKTQSIQIQKSTEKREHKKRSFNIGTRAKYKFTSTDVEAH